MSKDLLFSRMKRSGIEWMQRRLRGLLITGKRQGCTCISTTPPKLCVNALSSTL